MLLNVWTYFYENVNHVGSVINKKSKVLFTVDFGFRITKCV